MGRWRQLTALLTGTSAASLYASHTDFPLLSSSEQAWRDTPLRALSSISDYIHDISLPRVTRRALLGAYSAMLGITEDDHADLREYPTLRALRMRTISKPASPANPGALVAPCAGTVLAAGRAGAFGAVGDADARTVLAASERDPLCTSAVRVADGDSEAVEAALRFILIAPGASDAHSFVAPADFSLRRARAVDGALLASHAPRALARAERVVLQGTWEHGLFSLVALAGAGRRVYPADAKAASRGALSRGQPLPAVRMASAVAVLFESPDKSFEFIVAPGEHVQCGQPLAVVGAQADANKETSVAEQ